MDNTVVPPQVNPIPPAPQAIGPLPQSPQKKSNAGRNLIMILSAVLIVVILVATGYLIFLGSTRKTTYNAQVYNQPTVSAKPTATPQQTSYQSNPKDTSDQAIDQDSQAANKKLTNLDTDLSNVDQSLNDQATNLQ